MEIDQRAAQRASTNDKAEPILYPDAKRGQRRFENIGQVSPDGYNAVKHRLSLVWPPKVRETRHDIHIETEMPCGAVHRCDCCGWVHRFLLGRLPFTFYKRIPAFLTGLNLVYV